MQAAEIENSSKHSSVNKSIKIYLIKRVRYYRINNRKYSMRDVKIEHYSYLNTV